MKYKKSYLKNYDEVHIPNIFDISARSFVIVDYLQYTNMLFRPMTISGGFFGKSRNYLPCVIIALEEIQKKDYIILFNFGSEIFILSVIRQYVGKKFDRLIEKTPKASTIFLKQRLSVSQDDSGKWVFEKGFESTKRILWTKRNAVVINKGSAEALHKEQISKYSIIAW